MKKLKADIELLGLDLGKEIRNFVLLSLAFLALGAATFYFLGPSSYLSIPFAGYLFVAYLYFSRYGKALRKKEVELTDEFVTLFTFFGIYIEDGSNVYTALNQIKEFASMEMKRRLDELTSSIEQDKSVTPFVDFASTFSDISIRQVMLSVYQIIEEGQGGVYVTQFNALFGKLSDQKHRAQKERRDERLGSLSFLPLVGSGVAMITLSLSLMTLMEDMSGVL